MATTLETVAQNAGCDGIVDLADGGTLVIQEATTDLAEFTLQSPAFSAASSGTATLEGTTLSTTADADGTADSFEVRDSGSAVLWSGSVTETGGGGDIEIDNTSINSGQTVELTSYTFSVPAS